MVVNQVHTPCNPAEALHNMTLCALQLLTAICSYLAWFKPTPFRAGITQDQSQDHATAQCSNESIVSYSTLM